MNADAPLTGAPAFVVSNHRSVFEHGVLGDEDDAVADEKAAVGSIGVLQAAFVEEPHAGADAHIQLMWR